MKKVIITVISFVCYCTVLYGIKLMDLPGLITAFLVSIDIAFILLILIYAMGEKKQKPRNRVGRSV